jgi:hypothetical protein
MIDCGSTDSYNYLIATPRRNHLIRVGTVLGRTSPAHLKGVNNHTTVTDLPGIRKQECIYILLGLEGKAQINNKQN